MDDAEVISRYLQTEDPELFRLLVERYQGRIFRLAVSLLGPYTDADAEEVTQEVFLRAFKKLDQFRGEAQFGSWLYRIAYNVAMNHRNLARSRLPHVSVEEMRHLLSSDDPFTEMTDGERRILLAHCLEELPDVYRAALYLYYWLGCSVEEIGIYLDAPAGTVKSYLSRARQRVRDYLKTEGVTGVD